MGNACAGSSPVFGTKLQFNVIRYSPKALAMQGLSAFLVSGVVFGAALTSTNKRVILWAMEQVEVTDPFC